MYQNQYNPYGTMYQNPYGQPPYYNAYASLQNNQQNFPQPQQQPQNAQPQPQQQVMMQSNIEYVNGIEGAKAFILPPNTQKLLLDSDNPFFYIKTTDLQGKPSVRRFKYIDIDAEKVDTKQDDKSLDNYVSFDQFTQLLNDFNDLKDEFQRYKSTKNKKADESEVKK
jgi:hypothetical protein